MSRIIKADRAYALRKRNIKRKQTQSDKREIKRCIESIEKVLREFADGTTTIFDLSQQGNPLVPMWVSNYIIKNKELPLFQAMLNQYGWEIEVIVPEGSPTGVSPVYERLVLRPLPAPDTRY